MRRLFATTFFSLALFAGVSWSFAPVAHAITCPEGQVEGVEDLAGKCFPKAASSKSVGGTANYGTTPAAQTPVTPKQSSDDAFNDIMSKIMSLFAWLVGVAAVLLDNVVFYTVVKMGEYVKNLAAIGVAWRILRDVGNIMLIFGFLAIGITTIIDKGDWYGGGKKMLPMLFIGAIFLNFSLFITEAVIDTGNLFATQFYTQINGGNPAGVKGFDPGSLRVANEGISNKIMSQLGLANIYGQARNKTIVFEGANIFFIGFMGILLFIITSFVLFTLAFILLARFIFLIFLIILAPVGFAGLAVPQLSALARKWWDALFKQTLTAPVLLLLLYVALAVITDERFLIGGRGDWLGFVNGSNLPGFAGMLLSFLVAMGLLMFVVIAAKELSAFGADWASKTASKLSGASIAAAAPGWVGRNTIGFAGRTAAKGLGSTRFGRSFVGQKVVDTLDKKVAGASFDFRNTGVGKAVAGTGLDIGAGQKGGYTADLKSRTESYERAAGRIKGRDQTEGEKESLAKTEKKQKETEAEHVTAKSAHEAADKEVAVRKAEVARLEEEEKKGGKYWAESNPVKAQQLQTARQALTTGQTTLADTENKLKASKEAKESAEKEHKANLTKITEATSAAAAKKAYGEELEKFSDSFSITRNLKALIGDAAGEAAKKIIKGKSKEEEALDALKASIKKSMEEENKEKSDTSAAAPAPKPSSH